MDVGPVRFQVGIAGLHFFSLVPVEKDFFVALARRRSEDGDDVPGQLFIALSIVKEEPFRLICQEDRQIADTCLFLAIEHLFKEKKQRHQAQFHA